jgi:Leucine-rich repeat (LRR) protein
LGNVRELAYAGETIREVDMKSICHCKHLQVLHLAKAEIGDVSVLENLRDLRELTSLDLPFVNTSSLDMATGNANEFAFLKHALQLRVLRLTEANVDDRMLRRVRFLKDLEELYVPRPKTDWSVGIHGFGLTALLEMNHLRKLDLHGQPIEGSYLVNLKNLDSLEELDLGNTQVDNDSMAALATLKNLKRLNVQGTKVRGPGLRKLYRLKNQLALRITLTADDMEDVDGAVPIVGLEIRDGLLTASGADHLSLYPMLEELDLSDASIDDGSVEQLSRLTNLKKLDLRGTQIDDSGLLRLGGLSQLRVFRVAFTNLRGTGLEVLKKMPLLEELSLGGLTISDDQLSNLKGLRNLSRLTLVGTNLADAGLQHLYGLIRLREVYLFTTGITPQGKQKLRAALPKVQINGEQELGESNTAQ